MKPCRKHRRGIALLALDALSRPHPQSHGTHRLTEHEQALRAHIAGCAPCRQYLVELTQLAGRFQLTADNSRREFEVPDVLHRRILRALRTAGFEPGPLNPVAWVGSRGLQRRGAWLVFGAAAALALAVLAYVQLHPLDHPSVAPSRAVAFAGARRLPAPSVSEYMIVADRSLDQLDDLLTRQAKQNLPPAPVFTPSTPPSPTP